MRLLEGFLFWKVSKCHNMSGDFPFAGKIVSPLKCNEKPWDVWIDEIGHQSPRRDEDASGFTLPAAVDSKSSASARRTNDAHPYKAGDRTNARFRRAGVNRLRYDSMSLHGLFPQMDNLNATVCHMCGVIVKCSAAYRHLLESHTGAEPILPPPPPTVKLKSVPSRSRHKKEPPPPVPLELPKLEKSPIHTAPSPVPRVVVPQQDLQYVDDATTSALAEVQVSMESGELPVVSIQDTEELPLGENITDDIFAIMSSEGIQSADDITNATDWKNIIRDIGNMQEINFSSATDNVQSQDLYPTVDASLAGYTITDTDLSSLQFAPSTSPMLSSVIDNSVLNAQALKPAPTTPKSSTRKSSKTKFNLREYDPNKHCGVVTAENPKPCTRSLTCKAHALSLRRTVEGRAKPFDTLLAEHRASRDAAAAPPPAPLLVTAPDLALNGLAEPPDEAGEDAPAPPAPDVCWYAACPRPLALCTFNAAHAGGAVTLGKKFATVRSNIKSSLSRGALGKGAYCPGLALARPLQAAQPEVRQLVAACGGVQRALGELLAHGALNGHAAHAHAHKARAALKAGKRGAGAAAAALELGFALDPLLADEKC